MSLPGLKRDSFTASRPALSVDSEGVSVGALATAVTGWGTWGSPNAMDKADADQRGQQLDAMFATGASGIELGDTLVTRGHTYIVDRITDARFHSRIWLRRVDL